MGKLVAIPKADLDFMREQTSADTNPIKCFWLPHLPLHIYYLDENEKLAEMDLTTANWASTLFRFMKGTYNIVDEWSGMLILIGDSGSKKSGKIKQLIDAGFSFYSNAEHDSFSIGENLVLADIFKQNEKLVCLDSIFESFVTTGGPLASEGIPRGWGLTLTAMNDMAKILGIHLVVTLNPMLDPESEAWQKVSRLIFGRCRGIWDLSLKKIQCRFLGRYIDDISQLEPFFVGYKSKEDEMMKEKEVQKYKGSLERLNELEIAQKRAPANKEISKQIAALKLEISKMTVVAVSLEELKGSPLDRIVIKT